MISALLNHLWQSTLFAAAIALLALLLKKNRASVRYSLWLAASVKFLIPFSLFVAIGQQIDFRVAPPAAAAQVTQVAEQIGQPFTLALTPSQAPNAPTRWPTVLLSIWACGFAICLATWINRWRSLRRILRTAAPLPLQLPIPVLSSPARLEPGIFGIFRPVLLLPESIRDRLTPAQFQAILAHELTHLRRRDNLAAAIHMLVEAIFWFHPLVWWIEQRMVEERERACDQEVLRATGDSEAYAASILEVCKLYLESPLVCAAGVTGDELKKRIAAILTNPIALPLGISRKMLLAIAGVAAIAGPISIGALTLRAQESSEPRLAWDVISIKPSDPNLGGLSFGPIPGGGLRATGVTVRSLMEVAYDVHDSQIKGAPAWYRTERFDILAKVDRPEGAGDLGDAEDPKGPAAGRFRQRVRSLLTDRFQLSIRRENSEQPVYLLSIAKSGHKLQETDEHGGLTRNFGSITARGSAIPVLANILSSMLSRPVLDRTGLTGNYKFKLEFYEDQTKPKVKDDPTVSTETPPDAAGPSIFTAIQQQLGLKLESGKGPVENLVVERLEKPSAN
ncbi:MAG TPA: M56 family metallopeptidase [Bryobacteraceae bacterium]|nr:M56 family metallopeptidase [Bryobacteraceae bacterium]